MNAPPSPRFEDRAAVIPLSEIFELPAADRSRKLKNPWFFRPGSRVHCALHSGLPGAKRGFVSGVAVVDVIKAQAYRSVYLNRRDISGRVATGLGQP